MPITLPIMKPTVNHAIFQKNIGNSKKYMKYTKKKESLESFR